MSKALIIIDIQNDYFENGAMELVGSLKASENAKLVLSKFRNEKLPIVHIQHLSVSPDAMFFLPETKGQEIHENVKPLDGEKVITKYYPNSFRDTDLLDHLKSQNITELVISGMMTHMCVDATVRAAKDFDFECTVIGDACASRDLEIKSKSIKAEDVHNAFLSALSFFYADVKNTNEFLKTNSTPNNMTPIEVVTAYSIALSQGDIPTAFSHFSPDAKWHQPGNHQFAGTKYGLDEIGKMLGDMMGTTQGSLVIKPTGAMMTNGNLVSFPVHFSGKIGEKTVDMTGNDLFEVVDGKIVQVWLFSEDQNIEDEFWK